MNRTMKEAFRIIILKGMDNISGMEESSTGGSGKIIWCMEKVKWNGKMEGLIMENISMIRNMDSENLNSRMDWNILGIGLKGNNMGLEAITITKILKVWGSGRMGYCKDC